MPAARHLQGRLYHIVHVSLGIARCSFFLHCPICMLKDEPKMQWRLKCPFHSVTGRNRLPLGLGQAPFSTVRSFGLQMGKWCMTEGSGHGMARTDPFLGHHLLFVAF
jgi:hypothetical protein